MSTSSGGNAPTGTVTFFSGSTQLGSPVPVNGTDGSGNIQSGAFTPAQATAVLTTTQLPTGQDSITAKYNGDTNYSGSTSPAIVVSNLFATTATVQSSASSINLGASVTLNALVSTNVTGTPPTGTVTFFSGGTPLGAPVTVTGGTNSQGMAQATASLMTTALPAGSDSVTAAYSGDATYSSSTSPAIVINVAGPDYTLPASPLGTVTISAPGGSGTLSFMVTAVNGFNGTINFKCSTVPLESYCSPASVTGGGTVTINITTTAPHSAVLMPGSNSPGWWAATGGVTFVGIFLLGVPGQRRRWSQLLGLVTFALLITVAGCGGGSSGPTDKGTPPGSYNVTVTATATSGSPAHPTQTATFTLNVQ